MKSANDQMIEMLIDDLNYISNNMQSYIQYLKSDGGQASRLYFTLLINEVAGLRSKIEQAVEL